MTPKMDRERQFDAILTAADGDTEALRGAARQLGKPDDGMGADVQLLAQLREIAPAREEMDAARLRIGQRLAHDIFADAGGAERAQRPLRALRRSEPPETLPSPATPATASPRWLIQWSAYRRSIVTIAAAALLFLSLAGGVSAASASSLPESPLYGIKRVEESVLLVLPMSDTDRAQVLAMIARRRLTEAAAEAIARRDIEAASLLNEYTNAMRQLIMLAANVTTQGGDSSSIVMQIAQTVNAEQMTAQAATAQGQTDFVQALSASAADVSAALLQHHVTLPGTNGQNAQNNGHGAGAATATPAPAAGPTATPPGNSGSHSHGGHGHGAGSSSS